jgi:hypothetical protein
LRLSCSVASTLDLSLFWVNGWDAVIFDGSTMRTFAAAITWKPTPRVEASLVDMVGLEHPQTNLSGPLTFRNVVDASIVYKATEWFTLAASADQVSDEAEGDVEWWGASGYARAQALPWLWATLRGEYFSDPSGFATGTKQDLAEGTATLELAHDIERLRLRLRLEYRHDGSTAHPFDAALPASRATMDTFTVAGIVGF